MTTPTLAPVQPKVNAKRFVAPRSEFDQGKHNYRHGLDLATCATDDMTEGWLSCEANGERFGWQSSPAAQGEDAYWRAMMQQASDREVM
jgi:hypothetical protein